MNVAGAKPPTPERSPARTHPPLPAKPGPRPSHDPSSNDRSPPTHTRQPRRPQPRTTASWPRSGKDQRLIEHQVTGAKPIHHAPQHGNQPIQRQEDPPEPNHPVPAPHHRATTHNLPHGATQRTQARMGGSADTRIHPPFSTTPAGRTEVKTPSFTRYDALLTEHEPRTVRPLRQRHDRRQDRRGGVRIALAQHRDQGQVEPPNKSRCPHPPVRQNSCNSRRKPWTRPCQQRPGVSRSTLISILTIRSRP